MFNLKKIDKLIAHRNDPAKRKKLIGLINHARKFDKALLSLLIAVRKAVLDQGF
jgi:hypothetical protein